MIGTNSKLILLKIVSDNNGDYKIEDVTGGIKNVPNFKSLVCFGSNRIVVIFGNQLSECK